MTIKEKIKLFEGKAYMYDSDIIHYVREKYIDEITDREYFSTLCRDNDHKITVPKSKYFWFCYDFFKEEMDIVKEIFKDCKNYEILKETVLIFPVIDNEGMLTEEIKTFFDEIEDRNSYCREIGIKENLSILEESLWDWESQVFDDVFDYELHQAIDEISYEYMNIMEKENVDYFDIYHYIMDNELYETKYKYHYSRQWLIDYIDVTFTQSIEDIIDCIISKRTAKLIAENQLELF